MNEECDDGFERWGVLSRYQRIYLYSFVVLKMHRTVISCTLFSTENKTIVPSNVIRV